MRPSDALLRAAALAGLLAASPGSAQAPPPDPASPPAVVVELFTSQGCSSCPPADRLLSELGSGSASRVVPLAFHVDYWNHGGWTDPFSSREWSERQAAYARVLGTQNVYTPQAVVDGSAEKVGSDVDGLRSAIAAAQAKPAAAIALRLSPTDAKVQVQADVDPPAALPKGRWDLMLAVFETGLTTPVGRGENGGKTLRNDYVVRSLTRAGRVDGKTRLDASLAIRKDWDRTHLGVAAFLQDARTLEIRGCSASALAGPGGSAPAAF